MALQLIVHWGHQLSTTSIDRCKCHQVIAILLWQIYWWMQKIKSTHFSRGWFLNHNTTKSCDSNITRTNAEAIFSTGTCTSIQNLCHCIDYSLLNSKVAKGNSDNVGSEIFVSIKS